jgi:chitin disaccharide deacetylase
MSRYLIINADDFGLTQGVTGGIIDAANKGVVTSTSVMINELVYEKFPFKKSDCARLGIGLHLNLTQGRPILPAVDVTSLVAFDGFFMKPEKLFAHPERIHVAQVEKEWRAQIAAFKTVFGIPDHLDSHHHVHLYPSLFNLFCQLALEMKLPVRFPVPIENLPESDFIPYSFSDGAELLESQWMEERNLLEMVKLSYPDHFMDNFFYTHNNEPEIIQKIIDSIPEGTNEMMCHPGYIDDRLPRVSTYTVRREDELSGLKSGYTRDLLKSSGIELIRFSDI